MPLTLKFDLGSWADQTVGNDDDDKDVKYNGIFDIDPFTGTPIDDWPKNKNGAASGETVWWENDSTYDNKNHYITQLGLGHQMGMNLLHGIAEMIERIIFFRELLEKFNKSSKCTNY